MIVQANNIGIYSSSQNISNKSVITTNCWDSTDQLMDSNMLINNLSQNNENASESLLKTLGPLNHDKLKHSSNIDFIKKVIAPPLEAPLPSPSTTAYKIEDISDPKFQKKYQTKVGIDTHSGYAIKCEEFLNSKLDGIMKGRIKFCTNLDMSNWNVQMQVEEDQ